MSQIKENTPSDHQDNQKQQKAYDFISFEDRINLIEMILIEKKSIVHTAKQLNINLSTAKYILKCFRSKGKVMEKFTDKKLTKSAMKRRLQKLKGDYETIRRPNKHAVIKKSQNPTKNEHELPVSQNYGEFSENNNNIFGNFNLSSVPNHSQMCYIVFLQPMFQ